MPKIGDDIDQAARRLRAGQLVAFATETVYGLGALARDKQALAAMYQLKGRPRAHPCIIHLADFSQAGQWADVSSIAHKLATAFMPGALTLLLPAKSAAAHVSAGDAIALRVPSHPQARELLTRVGDGVAAPSANRFGKVSPTCAAHVLSEFPAADDLYILDGGECEVGVESAIVACIKDQVSVMRPGQITAEQIARVAQTKLSPPPDIAVSGALASHYAPQKPLRLMSAEELQVLREESAAVLSRVRPCAVRKENWLCAEADPQQYARRLYAALRRLDQTDSKTIIIEHPPDASEWAAIRDRLTKASRNRH